jgi:hypothetical protein
MESKHVKLTQAAVERAAVPEAGQVFLRDTVVRGLALRTIPTCPFSKLNPRGLIAFRTNSLDHGTGNLKYEQGIFIRDQGNKQRLQGKLHKNATRSKCATKCL